MKKPQEQLNNDFSEYEEPEIENLFDFIASRIGFENEEILNAIRLFGKKRFNQGVKETVKIINKKT